MADNQKQTRERKLNFTAQESNLISELATANLDLLRGKIHSQEVTNSKKQEMWKDITRQVNALGVCLRTEAEVRNRWRNLTRGAKDKFTAVEKERRKTGGGPPPTQPSQAEENIINSLRDSASFRGVPGGQETEIAESEDQREETGSVIMEKVWRRRLDEHFIRLESTEPYTHGTCSLTVATPAATTVVGPAETATCSSSTVTGPAMTISNDNERSEESTSEPPTKRPKRITADDVHTMQYKVLERELVKTNLQIQLLERLHGKLDDGLVSGILSVFEQ